MKHVSLVDNGNYFEEWDGGRVIKTYATRREAEERIENNRDRYETAIHLDPPAPRKRSRRCRNWF